MVTVSECQVDLTMPGQMKDIISNALMGAHKIGEPRVQSFLKGAETRFETGEDLLLATAEAFEIDPEELKRSVEEYRHVNCSHGSLSGDAGSDD